MAQRRMLSLKVIDTDEFLDMPQSSQYLYYNLAMRADDDGFISNPKRIVRMIGCNDDDLRVLISKTFIIPFESGVCVIRHWRIHNLIRHDRYVTTQCQKELERLTIDNGKYTTINVIPNVIPIAYQMAPQVRLGKVSIGKDRIDKERFVEPSLLEVKDYCKERNNKVNPDTFIDFYASKGWMVGKNKMKDWKAAVRNWERRDSDKVVPNVANKRGHDLWVEPDYMKESV